MAGPSFNTEFDARYGEVVEVSPLLRRVVCKNPSKFTFHGTGTYLIGRGDVAVVDPGPRDPGHIDAIVRALDGETVRHILITHTHGDHSPGAEMLSAQTGAPVLGFGGHPNDAVSEGDDHDGEDDDDGFDDDEEMADPDDPMNDPEFIDRHRPDVDFVPDTRLAHGDVVEGPGYTVEALHTPGHISNHLCFALREEDAVLSGDHVMGWSTTIIPPPDGDIAAYLQSLELLLERPEATLYPTHGPRIDGQHTYVKALYDHRLAREAAIIGQLTEGPKSAVEIVKVLYAEVDKRLHRPAARSVVSHLRKLHDDGTARPAVRDASTNRNKTVWELS